MEHWPAVRARPLEVSESRGKRRVVELLVPLRLVVVMVEGLASFVSFPSLAWWRHPATIEMELVLLAPVAPRGDSPTLHPPRDSLPLAPKCPRRRYPHPVPQWPVSSLEWIVRLDWEYPIHPPTLVLCSPRHPPRFVAFVPFGLALDLEGPEGRPTRLASVAESI